LITQLKGTFILPINKMKTYNTEIQYLDGMKKQITSIAAKKNKSIFNNTQNEIDEYVNDKKKQHEIIKCIINVVKSADSEEFLSQCIGILKEEYGTTFPFESSIAFLQKHISRDKPIETAPKQFKVKWTKQLEGALKEWHDEYLIKTNQIDALA
jgi:hypothetical protein